MNAISDLKWVFFMIAVLWFAWFFTGGPEGDRAQGGTFLKPPAPLDSGETYGELPSIGSGSSDSSGRSGGITVRTPGLRSTNEEKDSQFRNRVIIRSARGAGENNPNREYIELFAPQENGGPIYITDWTLQNSAGESAKIKRASKLPSQGAVNIESSFFLSPGEKAIIVTGYSPLGISFQLNRCTGYLSQFQQFYPSIENSCPAPHQSILLGDNLSSSCEQYIRTLPSCRVHTGSIPGDLPLSCSNFIYETLTYNGCVARHKNDTDFYTPEWRIYLGRENPLWNSNNETIRLYDLGGNLVDSASF